MKVHVAEALVKTWLQCRKCSYFYYRLEWFMVMVLQGILLEE